MRISSLTGLLGIASALLLAWNGCGKVEGIGDLSDQAPFTPDWHFDEGYGVKISQAGKDRLGIELSRVSYAKAGGAGWGRTVVAEGAVFSAVPEGVARASVSLPAGRAQGIEKGALVEAETWDGRSLSGRVAQVDRGAMAATGLVELVVELDHAGEAVWKGTFVTCRVAQNRAGSAETLVVPVTALLPTARGHFVYVARGGHFFRAPVQVGERGGKSVEIVEGLSDGEVVVSSGVTALWLVELQAINGGEAYADGF
jgi:multidrug efflux pump subunit AcrA (membrane-fusion protein)